MTTFDDPNQTLEIARARSDPCYAVAIFKMYMAHGKYSFAHTIAASMSGAIWRKRAARAYQLRDNKWKA